jgi:N-dimethylarginine dimethylaminohydrolase
MRFFASQKVVAPNGKAEQVSNRSNLACNAYREHDKIYLTQIAELEESVKKLRATVTQLLTERQYQQCLFDAADLIDMFGFYACGSEWKRICRSISRSQTDFALRKINKKQCASQINATIKAAPNTVDVVRLREISKLRNKQAHRDLSCVTHQAKFLTEMETRAWPKTFQAVRPCIEYLKLRFLKKDLL